MSSLAFILIQVILLSLLVTLDGSLWLSAGLVLAIAIGSAWMARRVFSARADSSDAQIGHARGRTNQDSPTRDQEELSTLMGALWDAILAVDTEGFPLFFNSRFILLFGDRDFQARRRPLTEVFRDPEVLEAFKKALQSGKVVEVSPVLLVKTSMVPRNFTLSIAPLRRSDGSVYGAVGIFHDVTELKNAEKIRIEFVANVSHELRTPLTAIKGYTDTLKQDVARKDYSSAEKFLGVITRNVDRLMELIQDLLDLSSLESADADESGALQKARIATRELTERVISQLEKKRSDKGIELEARYDAQSVLGDSRRIEQVLTNLIDNAVKYVPKGGKIQVFWRETLEGTFLHVKDNGPGIPAEHHSRLFERFYRVDKGRSRELGGTGLGLAIVKHIMQRHGGAIWVMSEPGQGTEFVCRFPG